MKKIVFNLVLLAAGLLVGTNAWATERTAGTFSDLQNALTNASKDDVIKLTADIAYPTDGTGLINITKSITLDGQGHTISGYGSRSGNKTTMAINNGGANFVEVTLKNLTIVNAGKAGRAIETRGKITSFTMDNCSIQCTGGGNTQPLTIGGSQSTAATVSITNSYLYAGSGGYPLISFNPYNLTTENTTYEGFCAMYFKGPDGSEGSHGTTINATDCYFDAPNVHTGGQNGFGVFELEEGGINITLIDCGMNAEELGDRSQELFVFSSGKYNVNTLSEPCSLTILGNNSHLNGQFYYDCWASSNPSKTVGAHTIIIKGGTYSVNPSNAPNTLATRYEIPVSGSTYNNFVDLDNYEVSEVTQYVEGKDPVTLYRVHPKVAKDEHGVAYKLNDNVENQGGGQNPNTSFILSADETVAAEKTYAEYVEVNEGTITIPTGKALNVGEAGLVVKEGAQIVVEAGGVLTVSKGGTISAKDESIIIGADATNGAGSYLVDPSVTFNQQPKATVKMTANIGLQGGDYKWHRFAMPVTSLENAWGKNPNIGTYLYGWDYENKDWKNMEGSTNMEPFKGYTVTTKNMAPGEMEFTFEGDLLGNVKSNIFTSIGYGYFGNSYTGYILAKTMLADFQDIEGVEGQVWMWDAANQSYSGVSLTDLLKDRDLEPFQREIAPMHTFILKTNSGKGATIDIDYIAAIWGNPRYGLVENPASAPARTKDTDDAFVGIKVISANGVVDRIRLTENAENSDMYENSVDATKYMNENSMNLYATVDGEDYTSLYTDNLLGKKLTLQTMDEVNYTLLVNDVIGSEYALQDMLTGEIISLQAGKTYSFSAQPNSTAERFQVVSARTMPTGTDKVVATKAAKGIYTMLGQYMGEASDWNKLPAGAYLVNGVKIVK